MRVDVHFTPDEVRADDLAGATAVVIDVVRATSCIVEAIANGARAVHPAVSVEEAAALRATLNGRGRRPLLCGERGGLRIEGFDLGNSPAEFTEAAVGGRSLVMTTTNGTRAFAAASRAGRVLAASFLNRSAVAGAVREDDAVAIVCAGKEGRFSLDDAVCAGHIVRALLDRPGTRVALADGAAAVRDLAAVHDISAGMLAGTAAGRALVDVGLGADLALCARADRHQIVPMMKDRVITAPRG
ncbi:MAG: 2-phosphosulfolactate phosphatase [Gemmatimonadota bacterium]|nr:2-phosphosulfolactate phosphatase [Gemmatimonadota bacterium]MDE2984375.1 2-phosphosulfolactate phosphatase [Gemmatimonadota bacterium]